MNVPRAASPAPRPAAPPGLPPGLPCALLCALLLGGCDGGLFGTGEHTDADAASTPSIDASGPSPADNGVAGTGGDADGGTDEAGGVDGVDGVGGAAVDGGDDADDAEDPTAPGAAPDSLAPDDDGFVNLEVTHERGVPLLRGANLTVSAVRVLARDGQDDTGGGGPGGGSLEIGPGTSSAAVALDVATDSLLVVDARSSVVLVEVAPVSLGASTLTTLVVFEGADGAVRAVPLATSAAAPDGGVADVRAILADGSEPGVVGLRPAGDDPGGARVDFAFPGTGEIASDYASATPGDYELVIDGDATGTLVSLEAGLTYSLAVRGSGGDVLVIVDGDLDGDGS